MASVEPISWLAAGEKYAIIGLGCETASIDETIALGTGMFALPHNAFELPPHWREWLGTTRSEEVEAYGLYIVAKQPSRAPAILDAENHTLEKRVGHFYTGLQLERKLSLYSRSFVASGGWNDNEGVDVRSFYSVDHTGTAIVNDWTPVSATALAEAYRIGARLEAILADRSTSRSEGRRRGWRSKRTLRSKQLNLA